MRLIVAEPVSACAFFAFLAAVFFAPALFTGAVLLPLDALFLYLPWTGHAAEFGVAIPNNHLITDTILQNYSWKMLAARSYAAGQFPLWNPYILAGQPFLAAAQNGSLYPLGVLFYLLPHGQAYGWFAALHLALGGALTYWFVRVVGGSRFGGLVAGCTFAFCGYLLVSVLWPMVVSTAVWMPGLLALVELLLKERESGTPRRRKSGITVLLVLAGAGLVTMQFLAGHLEMSLYLLITAGLYSAARLIGKLAGHPRCSAVGTLGYRPVAPSPRHPVAQSTATAGLLLAMVALGTLGAAIQLVPFGEVISANVRSGQASYDDVRGYALPRDQLLAFVLPNLFGNPSHHAVFDLWSGTERVVDDPLSRGVEPRRGTEWGPKNYVEGTAYLGVLPLLLAAVALLKRRDGPTWALAAVAAVSLLLAFGTPLYGLLFFGLPGVNQLHTPFRWIYPYSLCIAALAGLGATEIAKGRPHGGTETQNRDPSFPPRRFAVSTTSRPDTVGWLAFFIGAIGSLALLVAWLARESFLWIAQRSVQRSQALAEAFPDARALFSYEWTNLLGLALLLLASGLALIAVARRSPAAKPLVLSLLVGDLFTFGLGFNTVSDPAPLAFVPPEIRALPEAASPFRIATLGDGDVLPANTGMLFGLQDIRGYDTIILRDYVEYLELIEPQAGLLHSKIDKLGQPRSLDSPLVDLLNVKYVLTTMRVGSPGWQLVHEGLASAAAAEPVRVYENQRVIPRAFLVSQAVGAADGREARRLLARPEFNPRQEVVLEGIGLPPTPTVRQPDFRYEAAYPPSATITKYESSRVTVEVMAPWPSYLVLNDVYFPGWRVHVDGLEQPLLRANRIFRAVEVDQGWHQVTFEYRPLSFLVGVAISLVAIGVASLTLFVWFYRRTALAGLEAAGPLARVAKNSLFPLATGLLNRGFDFVFALIYLRLLGPQGTGAYTFAIVVVGYFDILVNFGLGTLLTREVARSPADSDRYFGNTLTTRLALASLSFLMALALVGPLAGPFEIGPEVGLAIVVLTLGLVPGALASTASAVFMAHERMEVPAAVTVFSTLAKIGLGTAVLLGGWGFVGLAFVSLLVNTLNAVALTVLMGALLGWPRLTFDTGFSRMLVGLSWPLMLNNFLNSLFFRIDAVLLKPLASEVALGHYATAYKFIDGLQVIPSTFVLALFPILSRQAAADRERLVRAFTLGLKVLLVLALPISVGTTLLAEPIIGLFAGPAFLPESALALQVLIWFVPFSFVNGLTQYVLIALNRQRWITLSFLVGAAANLALNLWAIPRHGFMGAAVVTVVSEWVLFVPFWYVVRRELPPLPLLGLVWRPALAALVMGVVVFSVSGLSPWLAIPVGACVYTAALLALGTLTGEEWRALKESRARSSVG